MKNNVCKVCKSLLKSKVISYEGKKFCCNECCKKFKLSKRKKVCEFC